MTIVGRTSLSLLIPAPCAAAQLSRSTEWSQPVPPNVVIVLVEGLEFEKDRADDEHVETTRLRERFGREGVIFSDAVASAIDPLGSVASLFTGRVPAQLGSFEADQVKRGFSLPVPTIAQKLVNAGYRTVAVVGPTLPSQDEGFARGFDTYVRLPVRDRPEVDYSRTWPLRTVAKAEVNRLRESGRYFVYLHVSEPAAGVAPSSKGTQRRVSLENALHDFLGEITNSWSSPDTIVIVTSDYGERARESGPRTATEAQLRIPVLVWWKSIRPARVNIGIDHTDIHRLVLGTVGLVSNQDHLLRVILRGDTPGDSVGGTFTQFWIRWRDGTRKIPYTVAVYREWPYKVVLVTASREVARALKWPPPPPPKGLAQGTGLPSGAALYDLSRDPSEKVNLIRTRASLAERMMARIATKGLQRPGERLPQELLERLRSLGYIR